mgnify:CR=1 FL=1
MKQSEQPSNEKGGAPQGEIHNNEIFNQMLNRCKHPRQICSALMALVEPGVEQANDVTEKRKILIGNLLSGLDIAEGDKQSI